MKLLKNLIYKIILMLCLLVQLSLSAQDFTARIGIYDFTDEAATEFYVVAPTVIFGYDCLKISRLTLNVSAGFSFNSFKYQSKKHNLYMVPLFVSMLYELTNPESKVHPYIGGGFSLLGKADKNQTLKTVHYSFTYGYHAIGCLHIDLKRKTVLTFDMRYNFLITPAMEELNPSGIISTVGIRIPVGSQQ